MKPLNNKSKWSKPRDSDQAHLILFFLKTILLQKLIKLMNNSFYWGLDSRQMREMSWLKQSQVMSQYWLMTDRVMMQGCMVSIRSWWCNDWHQLISDHCNHVTTPGLIIITRHVHNHPHTDFTLVNTDNEIFKWNEVKSRKIFLYTYIIFI